MTFALSPCHPGGGSASALPGTIQDTFGATTIVNPGFFRTDLLSEKSTAFAPRSIEDYDERRKQQLAWWTTQGGQQTGDPAKLARALIKIASGKKSPRRFIAGADAVGLVKQRAADLLAQSDAYPELSTDLAYD